MSRIGETQRTYSKPTLVKGRRTRRGQQRSRDEAAGRCFGDGDGFVARLEQGGDFIGGDLERFGREGGCHLVLYRE